MATQRAPDRVVSEMIWNKLPPTKGKGFYLVSASEGSQRFAMDWLRLCMLAARSPTNSCKSNFPTKLSTQRPPNWWREAARAVGWLVMVARGKALHGGSGWARAGAGGVPVTGCHRVTHGACSVMMGSSCYCYLGEGASNMTIVQ